MSLFRSAFPSYTLLMLILLFTSEIQSRIYLKLEEISFLKRWRAQQRHTVSVESHSCWRVSRVFLEWSLCSFHPHPSCNTWRTTRNTDEWREALPWCLPRLCWWGGKWGEGLRPANYSEEGTGTQYLVGLLHRSWGCSLKWKETEVSWEAGIWKSFRT